MIATISFYVSFIGILGMIFLKVRELRTDKKSLFAIFSEKTDHLVHAGVARVRLVISYFNRKTAVALVQLIAYHILSWARRAYIWLHRKAHAHPPSKKVIDMVRGRGEVHRSGGASFYLKKISEGEAK